MTWVNGITDEGGFSRYSGPSLPATVEQVCEFDWAGSWEFDMITVWRDKTTGELRAATDSGCSCPTPFSDLTWDGMLPIREVDDLRHLFSDQRDDSEGLDCCKWTDQDEQLATLKRIVHEALRDAPAKLTSDGILVRFMAQRYKDWPAPLMRVEIEEEHGYYYSEYTWEPGGLRVKCFIDTGTTPYYTEYVDDAKEFIHELCRFAAELVPA
jgi:hypothetical protein